MFLLFIFISVKTGSSKEIPNSSKSTDVGQTNKHKSTLTPKPSAPTSCQQKCTTPTQQTNATSTQHADVTPTQQTCATPTQSHSHMEAKSKKKGKKNKSGGEQKCKESVSSSQTPPPSPSNLLPTNVSPAKTTQKSGIKATSTGLPVPPPTTPKLEKATPYEFLQAWNSLKNVMEIQPYVDLLQQIPPKDLTCV